MPRITHRTKAVLWLSLAFFAVTAPIGLPSGGLDGGEAPDGVVLDLDPTLGMSDVALLLHASDEEQTPGTLVARPVRSDRSPALRTIALIPGGGVFEDHPVKARKPIGTHGSNRSGGGPGPRTPDPVVQDATAATNQQISAIVSFDGIGNRNQLVPPDPSGDIGPNHYVQWVNTSLAVFDRQGAILYGPTNGNAVWAGFGGVCETRNDGDPIVQYDHLADRWLISQFAVPGRAQGYHECIAVSVTPDPTGAWYRYDYLMSTKKMNDYPKFGVWPDGYYMSINQFSNGAWAGAGAAVFERTRLLAGDPDARMILKDLSTVDMNLGGMLPADLDGPAPAPGTPNIFAEIDDGDWGYTAGVDQLQLWRFQVDWSAATATFTRSAALPVAPFDWDLCGGARNCIPQQGSSERLDAIPDRLLYRLSYRLLDGRATLVVNHSVDADGTDRAGVRWYQLEQSDGTSWSIRQQGTFAPADGLSRWMASAAMNRAGDLALGYSVSGATRYPSIRQTGRLGTDASAGQMTLGEASLIEGTGAQTTTTSRWGDYSQLALDPLDDCTFWFTSEYLAEVGVAPWRTRIGSFRLSSCGLPAGTLTGRLTDAVSGRPIPDAKVEIPGLGIRTTGVSGDYSFADAYAGSYTASISVLGYPETTTGVTIVSGVTTRLDLTLTAFTSSGWMAPSAHVAATGGDGNGYESGTTLVALGASGGEFASDVRSGTKNSTQCDSASRDRHDFTTSLPVTPGRVITGVRVRLRVSASTTSGTPKVCVLLSWDGGKTWTDPKTTPGLTTTAAAYVLGSETDPWQVAKRNRAWTLTELADLRIRLVDVGSTTTATYYLDTLEANASFK